MTKLDILKAAAKFIVGSGTTTIVYSIIRNNVQPANTYQAVSVAASSLAIGMMVADITSRYTEAQINSVAVWWNDNVKK
jgi:hypothetical protein